MELASAGIEPVLGERRASLLVFLPAATAIDRKLLRIRVTPARELPAHSEAATAAETFAMHRMTQNKSFSLFVAATTLALCTAMGGTSATAGPPNVRHADVDYDASGYVVPAGMVPPSMYRGGVVQVGCASGSCDMIACDGGCASGGCDAGCDGGCDACDEGYGILDGLGGGCMAGRCQGGLLGKLTSGNGCYGCGTGMSSMRHLCFFCRGGGCSACQFLSPGAIIGAMQSLRPYTEAGLCAQRWYDLSAEAMFLRHSSGGLSGDITSRGTAPLGPIVLRLGDADGGDDYEAGVRVSASFIFGAGGNIEGTYIGANEWDSTASAFDPGAGLFSFISDFGTNPPDNAGTPAFDPGFDDTDRSLVQSVSASSEFHSGELNYRRRTMGPYCRFQTSWLVGLRYVRFENGLLYSALGENDNTVNANLPRFFSSNDQIKNDLFGAQAGFDLWWNMTPGINLGIGMKGAWVQNDIDRRFVLSANSINVGGPGTVAVSTSEQDNTVMGELEAKMVYRLTHSWSVRSSYYAVAIEDIAFGTTDRQTIRDFVQANPLTAPRSQLDTLVVQGFSFGAEYMW